MTTLQAKQLSKHFSAGRTTNRVLEEIDLELQAGQLTLLMGPSGSGKSTLLSTLSGLQRPDGGEVVFDGENIWQGNDKRLCEFRLANCAFVFQEVNLFSCLSGLDQIRLVLEHRGAPVKEAMRRAEEGLAEVDLEDKGHLMPTELSGGEKQRIAIARALALGAPLIFADEPTSSLDSNNGQRVVDLLRSSAKKFGAMVLCATHDERVRRSADRIIYLEDGDIKTDQRRSKTV